MTMATVAYKQGIILEHFWFLDGASFAPLKTVERGQQPDEKGRIK